jgi:hypothetical protein
MEQKYPDSSLQALADIRSIMNKSARFLTLSGWSGVWAGCTALVGSWLAYQWLHPSIVAGDYAAWRNNSFRFALSTDNPVCQFILLGGIIFLVALAGAYFFTWRKAKQQGEALWNSATRQFLFHFMLPLIAGGLFVLGFLYHGHEMYAAPACLIFYGLALINGSKFTLSDIRYLGIFEVILGSICIYFPGYGLYFWAAGFGLLHILYGIIMWNKYDKNGA